MNEVIGGAIGAVLIGFWLLWLTSLPRQLFPKTYQKLCDKIDAWGEGPKAKETKPKSDYQVGIKHQ